MSDVKGNVSAPPPAMYNAPTTTHQPAPSGPPPAYPAAQQATTTVVVQQPVVATNVTALLGTGPTSIMCPHCNQMVVTRCEYVTGTGTWVAVGVLALIGLWCGCCLIPLCIDAAKDASHTCSNCGKFIGVKERMGGL